MRYTSTLLRWVLPIVLALAAAWTPAATAADDPALEKSFLAPPVASKPWAYWWWLGANVTRESITRDLEGMKAKGLGGFLLFDVTAYGHHLVPAPERRVQFMSPEWRKLVHFAMSEAGRLGLQMSMNLSTCGGTLQAPWDMGENAPKRLVWTSAEVTGPVRLRCRLEAPRPKLFWDVAVVAARHAETADLRKNKLPKPVGRVFQPVPENGRVGKPVLQAVQAKLSGEWSPARFTLPKDARRVTDVVDLTSKVDARGQLTCDLPEGRWTLIRFGCETIKGHEKDVDILNRKAAAAHFERIGKVILQDAGPLAGRTLTHFYNVSWEGASPTWTIGFEEDFLKHRGYAIRPYLPVLAGMVVTSREVSQRFVRDHCRTLSDCFLHNSYGQFTELCHQAGLKWHSESGGPWRKSPLFVHADQLAFWGHNDMPQGEFWWPSGRSNARRTAMAAHVYGKRLSSIEAFTHMQPHWTACPATLKPLADAAFCDGVNQFVWHTCSASPAEFGKPGIVYFAGTHLNPNVTWWEQAGAYLKYLARCQHVLRQGRFVADVCCYNTDRNQANWTRGQQWSEKASLSLPKGYTYDLLNTDVLLNRLSVDHGDLVLPDGLRYRLLVVDLEEEAVPPEALQKLVKLAQAGATIVLGRRRPTRAPGLADYPACDQEVRRLAEELWGGEGDRPGGRALGGGKVVRGMSMEQVLRAEGIRPDCDAPCDYIHRRVGEADIYFLAGSGTFEATFRVCAKEPELWDPKTGGIRDAVHFRTAAGGRTVVPLALADSGSVFVVFRKPARGPHVVSVSGPEAGLEIEGRSDSAARLRLWQQGRYVLATSQGKKLSVDVPKLAEPQALSGPWEVRFAPGWGAPESIVFDRLVPWNEHPLEGIKHFSGTATYRKTFQLNSEQAAGLVRLQLGQLKHVARVRVNGKDLGVLWTAPWAVDLTGAVKPGENALEIDVTNTWANRLIGDAGLPPDRRRTKTNIKLYAGKRDPKLRACQGYASEHPLLDSGLIGPVRLQFGRQRDVAY